MGIRRGEITTKIVSDGLVFNIDPANRASYPRTGTSVENTIFSSTGTMSATGMFDTSNQDTFAFDGAGDNIDFADNSLYDFTDAISVFGWIYVTVSKSSPGNQYLLSKQNLYDIIIEDDESINFYGKNLSTPSTKTNASTINLNQWEYVGATYDRQNCKVYINGELKKTQSNTNSLGTDNNPVRIGSYSNGGGAGNSNWDMNGNIGITHIYNRALSAEEVLRNYNGLRGRVGV